MKQAQTVRVGGIDYLNAQPLLWGLESDSRLEVTHHRPSRLASLLAEGGLDTALIPVVAYADLPDYRIIPDLCIASHGPVRSIRLYHRCSLSDVRRVGLDTSSRSSVLLTRLLFRSLWRCEPEFVDVTPARLREDLSGRNASWDAALLIGDDALSCGEFPAWRDLDLGSSWTHWTGKPFVYAFWAVRADAALRFEPELIDRFRLARERGFAHIDDIARDFRRPQGMSETDCRDYLARVIQYDLRDDKLAGLELFFEKLRESDIIDMPPLRFLETADAPTGSLGTLSARADGRSDPSP